MKEEVIPNPALPNLRSLSLHPVSLRLLHRGDLAEVGTAGPRVRRRVPWGLKGGLDHDIRRLTARERSKA